jgi:hypothetical protein
MAMWTWSYHVPLKSWHPKYNRVLQPRRPPPVLKKTCPHALFLQDWNTSFHFTTLYTLVFLNMQWKVSLSGLSKRRIYISRWSKWFYSAQAAKELKLQYFATQTRLPYDTDGHVLSLYCYTWCTMAECTSLQEKKRDMLRTEHSRSAALLQTIINNTSFLKKCN